MKYTITNFYIRFESPDLKTRGIAPGPLSVTLRICGISPGVSERRVLRKKCGACVITQ